VGIPEKQGVFFIFTATRRYAFRLLTGFDISQNGQKPAMTLYAGEKGRTEKYT
jgi:hypothetical protein